MQIKKRSDNDKESEGTPEETDNVDILADQDDADIIF
jgi:hypothetical protein